ncbi:MAG: DUF167 domain-containing protein [Pseudomonadota bacterium]
MFERLGRRAGWSRVAREGTADGPRLRIAVTAPAEDGRANDAVRAALGEALGVPQASIALRHGATSREKSFHIAGDTGHLIARLEALA